MDIISKEYEVDPDFTEAAKPLAEYLARLHLNDPTHKFVLADLYDLVNNIRDERVREARHALRQIAEISGFTDTPAGRARLARLNDTIRKCEGLTA